MSFERRKSRVGTVVSNRMDQTVVVVVDWRMPHILYKKPVKRRTRFNAHDRDNQCRPGDVVRIIETRPLSKTKRWRVVDILSRKDIAEIQPEEIVVDGLRNGDDSLEHLPEARDEAGASVGEAGEIGVAVAVEAVTAELEEEAGPEPAEAVAELEDEAESEPAEAVAELDEEAESETATAGPEDEEGGSESTGSAAEIEVVEQEEVVSRDPESEPPVAVAPDESSQESGDDKPVGADDEGEAVGRLAQEEAVDVAEDKQTGEESSAQEPEVEAASEPDKPEGEEERSSE